MTDNYEVVMQIPVVLETQADDADLQGQEEGLQGQDAGQEQGKNNLIIICDRQIANGQTDCMN